jgi:hypothetical protein
LKRVNMTSVESACARSRRASLARRTTVARKRSTKFGRKPPGVAASPHWEVERKGNMKVRQFGILAHRYDREISLQFWCSGLLW